MNIEGPRKPLRIVSPENSGDTINRFPVDSFIKNSFLVGRVKGYLSNSPGSITHLNVTYVVVYKNYKQFEVGDKLGQQIWEIHSGLHSTSSQEIDKMDKQVIEVLYQK